MPLLDSLIKSIQPIVYYELKWKIEEISKMKEIFQVRAPGTPKKIDREVKIGFSIFLLVYFIS